MKPQYLFTRQHPSKNRAIHHSSGLMLVFILLLAACSPTDSGASDDHVHGVYAQWMHAGSGLVARPRVLFTSGDVLKDMSLPPDEVTVASRGNRDPGDWGQWQIQGDEYVIQWDDDPDSTSNWPLDSGTFFPVHPAPDGLDLEGVFRSTSTMSVSQPSGTQVSAAWRNLAFSPDGRFARDEGIQTSAPGLAAGQQAGSTGGEYRLDGHAIELRFDDGQVERTGFFIVASRDYDGEAPTVIGIGNSIYTRSRTRD